MRNCANFRTVFSESRNANPLDAEPETDFNAKWSFKVIYFNVTEEPLRDYMAQYNNCGLRCGGSEDIARKISENRILTTPLSFEAPWPANPCEYPHKLYFARNCDPWATFSSLIVWVYLHSNFSGWLRNTCVMQQST